MWLEARRRGLEVVVVIDDKTSPVDQDRIEQLADRTFLFRSRGYCEAAFEFVQQCSGDFVLRIDDDEEPSSALWDFQPPFEARFGVPVVPILCTASGDKIYLPDMGIQERLFARRGWRWVGGFEGHSEGARSVILAQNPGILIWHYDLEAPRAEREAKARRYEALDPATDHRTRLMYEDHPKGLAPLGELAKYLR